MTTQYLARLLSVAGPALCGDAADLQAWGGIDTVLVEELARLLTQKNGFYAFDEALHVLPCVRVPCPSLDLRAWNESTLWRARYGAVTDGCLFFAEDVFGAQFCLRGSAVCSFDPEQGSFATLASSLELWAEHVLRDQDYVTGESLAREWKAAHGPIAPGYRLVPIKPFVIGGDYDVANLRSMPAEEGMKYRAQLASQVRGLADGSDVELVVTNKRS